MTDLLPNATRLRCILFETIACHQPTSALSQKQTYAVQNAMSALPPKADIDRQVWNVRFGPIADIAPANFIIRCNEQPAIKQTGTMHHPSDWRRRMAQITIQLDLGRRSLTVPLPSRPPYRSRWEARRFGVGA